MIAYGVCIGSEDKYQAFARQGLDRCATSQAPIAECRESNSIFTAYNEILEAYRDIPSLEAVVLLHEDVELRDPLFEDKVRHAMADPDIAILGVIGARSVSSLAWWEGEGRGRCAESRGVVDYGGGSHDVDTLDGLLLALSPWAARSMHFDAATYHGFHGYDADICFQARAARRRVRVMEVDLFHHTKGGFGDEEAYRVADAAFRTKWARCLVTDQAH